MAKQNRTALYWIIGLVVLMAIVLNPNFRNTEDEETDIEEAQVLNIDWQAGYESAARESLGSQYNGFTANTDYYRYDDPEIVALADEIASKSKDARQAAAITLEYVYDNIDYVFGEADSKCFNGNAPDILASGSGQCDTQSIVVMSVLRRMGIATAPAGGCIYVRPECYLQSVLAQSAEGLGVRAPKFQKLQEVDEETGEFSRTQSITSRTGGLHAWPMVWLPEEGWVPMEATAGQFADLNCWNYHVELYPENDEKNLICVTTNFAYAKACLNEDMDSLDGNGLGLVQEATP